MSSSARRTTPKFLADIVIWGDRLARFIDGVSKAEFGSDELRQMGVSKCIEVIGEAAGNIAKVDPAFVQLHPGVGLIEAYRARNRLAHGYDTIDWTVLWDTATTHIPPLVAFAGRHTELDAK